MCDENFVKVFDRVTNWFENPLDWTLIGLKIHLSEYPLIRNLLVRMVIIPKIHYYEHPLIQMVIYQKDQ